MVPTGSEASSGSALRLHGGASIPISVGWLSVSAPLVRLEAPPTGISLTVRSRIIRKFFGAKVPWTVAWDEIDHVVTARHSVVIVPKHGRNCRFVTLAAGSIRALLQVMNEVGVPTVARRTTIFKLFTGRPSVS